MQNTDTGFQITAGSAERVPQKPIASETDPDVKRKNASSQEVDWGLQESTPFMAGSFKLKKCCGEPAKVDANMSAEKKERNRKFMEKLEEKRKNRPKMNMNFFALSRIYERH